MSAASAITLGTDDPAAIALGGGGYDIIGSSHTAGILRGEYRFNEVYRAVRPILGVEVTTKGSAYGYGGVDFDIALAPKWVLIPNAAVGVWERGNGRPLGSWLEFRTGAELDYRVTEKSQLGLAFHHISNGGITRINPGEEEMTLNYVLPLDLFGP